MLEHLYSGDLFFSSLAVLVVVALVDVAVRIERPLAQSVARVVALLAIALAVMSATPVPLWLAIPAAAAALAYVFAGIGAPSRTRVVTGLAAVVAALACLALEAGHRVGRPELQRPARLVVVGDSLSSGGFGEAKAWPGVLASRIGCEVVNLSRPGDTTAAAIEGQLPEMPEARTGDLVIVQVGGNDMLEGVAARVYAENLAVLSGLVADERRRLVMLELPLLPGRWGYGAAQRRVARDGRAVLVPKRILASVLLQPGNTSDGLHLTQQGHDALATAIAEWAGWGETRSVERGARD
jgi:acyl-CoA thioesterase I